MESSSEVSQPGGIVWSSVTRVAAVVAVAAARNPDTGRESETAGGRCARCHRGWKSWPFKINSCTEDLSALGDIASRELTSREKLRVHV